MNKPIMYVDPDGHIALLALALIGIASLNNLVSYIGLYVNRDILSTSNKFGIIFLENVGPSSVGLGITTYVASLPKPNFNELRDEERIKSQQGRFIGD